MLAKEVHARADVAFIEQSVGDFIRALRKVDCRSFRLRGTALRHLGKNRLDRRRVISHSVALSSIRLDIQVWWSDPRRNANLTVHNN